MKEWKGNSPDSNYEFRSQTTVQAPPKEKPKTEEKPVRVVYIGDKKPLSLSKPKDVNMPTGGSKKDDDD